MKWNNIVWAFLKTNWIKIAKICVFKRTKDVLRNFNIIRREPFFVAIMLESFIILVIPFTSHLRVPACTCIRFMLWARLMKKCFLLRSEREKNTFLRVLKSLDCRTPRIWCVSGWEKSLYFLIRNEFYLHTCL